MDKEKVHVTETNVDHYCVLKAMVKVRARKDYVFYLVLHKEVF